MTAAGPQGPINRIRCSPLVSLGFGPLPSSYKSNMSSHTDSIGRSWMSSAQLTVLGVFCTANFVQLAIYHIPIPHPPFRLQCLTHATGHPQVLDLLHALGFLHATCLPATSLPHSTGRLHATSLHPATTTFARG